MTGLQPGKSFLSSEPWIMTHSGNRIFLNDPNYERINIYDIAHSLSMLCRWNGMVNEFFSVAAHCLFCSYIVPEEEALRALLHDASEAYLGDVSHPLKKLLPDYKQIEEKWDKAIAGWAQIDSVHSDIVKQADRYSLSFEAMYLMPTDPTYLDLPPVDSKDYMLFRELVNSSPETIHDKFLERYFMLHNMLLTT